MGQDPGFWKWWKSPDTKSRYHLTVCCLTRGLSLDETITVVWIWHTKHGRAFSEQDFLAFTYPYAAQYAAPRVAEYLARQSRDDLMDLAVNSGRRLHSRFIVAMVLDNIESATAVEISVATGLPAKTVRNCVARLQRAGRVETIRYATYRAVPSLFWDRSEFTTDQDGELALQSDGPRHWLLAEQGIEVPRLPLNLYGDAGDGVVEIQCIDYCHQRLVPVLVDNDDAVLERLCESTWVVDHDGDVVEDGSLSRTGQKLRLADMVPGCGNAADIWYRNDNKLDCRRANIIPFGVPPADDMVPSTPDPQPPAHLDREAWPDIAEEWSDMVDGRKESRPSEGGIW